MTSRTITAEDQAKAKRLRAIWDRKKTELALTQKKAAELLGYSNQGVVGQYINGHIALNTDAIIKFAKLLRVAPFEIDPTLKALTVTDDVPRRVKVAVMAYLSGVKPDKMEMVEVLTTMNRPIYAVKVDNETLEPFAKKGSTLIVSSDEEPVSGDDIYMQVESTPGCIVQRVATFVMINQADETMICRELGQKDTFT
ncbi:helix-turn-helix transcriptional regulator, partial [Pseudomonas luteola]|uniref:helix-turn-helix domain-containing protein n=1 Tax=Pseudomonas luteola TaxID=47886 RepID=UPI003A8BC653